MDKSLYAHASSISPVVQQGQNQYHTAPPPWRNPSYNAHAEPVNRLNKRAQHTKGDYYYGGFSPASVDIYALVDSWRSYKADTTNLQSTATPASGLNAAAPSFQPTQNASSYKPYEPLRSVHHYARYPTYRVDKPYRTSDGSQERRLVEQAKKASGVQHGLETGTGFATRYPVRSNRAQADQPISSIEAPDLDYRLKTNNLNKTLEILQNPKYRHIPTRSKTPRQTKSPTPPNATDKYRAQATKNPVRVAEPRKLLVILDLNGTLLYRNKSPNRKVYMRPGVTPLLDYLFANHVVMVYTSTMPETATQMVNQFLHPSHRNKLAAIWARDKLDLTEEQYRNKVQVYKKLDKIWADKEIQATAGVGKTWDQSNTILVDDSKLKALAQPHNLLQVLEYTKADEPSKAKDKATQKQRHKLQVDTLKQLELKLEELKYQEDVSRLIRKWQAGQAPVPKLPGQTVSVEEYVDQKKVQLQKEADEVERENSGRSQLPTPVSLADGDTPERPVEISDEEDLKGGLLVSRKATAKKASKNVSDIQISGLGILSEEPEDSRDRGASESSVDEATFQQLLGADRK